MRSSVYFLSFALGMCMCLALGVRGDEDCEECTFEADSSIQSVCDLLANTVPITIDKVKPCKSCKIRGIESFKRRDNMPVCSHKDSDGSQSHDFNVVFKNVSVECVCVLSSNPADVAKELTAAQSAVPDNCPPDAAADGLNNLQQNKPIKPTLTDLMKTKECMPAGTSTSGTGGVSVGGVGAKISIGRRATAGTVTGNLYAYWLGVLVHFTSKVPAAGGMVAIRSVRLVSENYKDVRARCTGEPGFPESCNCLLAGNFHVSLVLQAVQMLVPCNVDDQTKKHSEIVNYFKCSEDK